MIPLGYGLNNDAFHNAYYGHPLGTSGAIEGVICALAIRDGSILPTLNYQTTDPAYKLDVVPNEPREKNLKRALSKAFGFGGINSCIVTGRYKTPAIYAVRSRS
jgi:3-oxoacyl-[acyl-carrier-protein] synthase II